MHEVKESRRATIMDGEVVTYATNFKTQGVGAFIQNEPLGPFEVSVSRNRVMIHRASIQNVECRNLFMEALERAFKQFDAWNGYAK